MTSKQSAITQHSAQRGVDDVDHTQYFTPGSDTTNPLALLPKRSQSLRGNTRCKRQLYEFNGCQLIPANSELAGVLWRGSDTARLLSGY